MCDKFDRSVLLLLDQFDEVNPRTIREALASIEREELYSLSLSVRPPVEYIQRDLAGNGYLRGSESGYVISQKGMRIKERLEEITLKDVEVA